MPTRDAYRKKADACLKATEAMRDPTERLAMLQMAQGYLKLANRAGAPRERSATPREQGEPRAEKRDLERFGSALRDILGRADDQKT
jgi:hypothetical protein